MIHTHKKEKKRKEKKRKEKKRKKARNGDQKLYACQIVITFSYSECSSTCLPTKQQTQKAVVQVCIPTDF
jgi:hypothetical protein